MCPTKDLFPRGKKSKYSFTCYAELSPVLNAENCCFQAVMLSCILYICTYFVFYKSLPTPLCPTVPLSERCLIVNKNPFVVNACLDWCHHLSEENGLVCMFSDCVFVLLSGECPVSTLWRLTTFRGSRTGRYMYFRVLDVWDWKKARLWAVPDTVFLNTGYQVHFLVVTVNGTICMRACRLSDFKSPVFNDVGKRNVGEWARDSWACLDRSWVHVFVPPLLCHTPQKITFGLKQ